MRFILGLVLGLFLATSPAHAQQFGPRYCSQMASFTTAVVSAVVAPESGSDGLFICGYTMSSAAASVVTFSNCIAGTTIAITQLGTTTTVTRGFGPNIPAGDALCISATTAVNLAVYYSTVPGPTTAFFPGATIDCNLITNVNRGTCTLTVTRAGANATDLLPTSASGASFTTFAANALRVTSGQGLLVEESRVNQLFNSTVPATQTTPSLGTATYTLWVNGSGTATVSAGSGTGCGTGVASQGTPVNFTISIAGTCTVTVAGSLRAFQLEAGTFGTSLIVTAGATGTRATDVIAQFVQAFGSAYSAFAQGVPLAPAAYATAQNLFQTDNATDAQSIKISRVASTGAVAFNMTGGAGTTFSPTGTWATGTTGKLAFSAQVNAQASVFNNGTVATGAGATLPTTPTGVRIGQNITTPLAFNGYIQRFAIWPNAAISNAMLGVITR